MRMIILMGSSGRLVCLDSGLSHGLNSGIFPGAFPDKGFISTQWIPYPTDEWILLRGMNGISVQYTIVNFDTEPIKITPQLLSVWWSHMWYRVPWPTPGPICYSIPLFATLWLYMTYTWACLLQHPIVCHSVIVHDLHLGHGMDLFVWLYGTREQIAQFGH